LGKLVELFMMHWVQVSCKLPVGFGHLTSLFAFAPIWCTFGASHVGFGDLFVSQLHCSFGELFEAHLVRSSLLINFELENPLLVVSPSGSY